MQGCQIFLENFLQIFKILYRFLKLNDLGSNFSLKLNLRLKTVLNSMRTLNKYLKASLSVFFIKQFLMMTKKIMHTIVKLFAFKLKFYYLIYNSCLKFQVFQWFLFEILDFIINFLNSRFFSLNCQSKGSPGFSKVSGFLATLICISRLFLAGNIGVLFIN